MGEKGRSGWEGRTSEGGRREDGIQAAAAAGNMRQGELRAGVGAGFGVSRKGGGGVRTTGRRTGAQVTGRRCGLGLGKDAGY